MADILHRVGVEGGTPEALYDALTTIEGLASWWTRDTTGDPGVGGTIAFRFPEGGFDMVVRESIPGKAVLWEVVDGPEEWVGTEISFDIRQNENFTIVLFEHRGWREPVEFMAHCSTKWATFLVSLKQFLETGAGDPAPDDLKVSDWH